MAKVYKMAKTYIAILFLAKEHHLIETGVNLVLKNKKNVLRELYLIYTKGWPAS